MESQHSGWQFTLLSLQFRESYAFLWPPLPPTHRTEVRLVLGMVAYPLNPGGQPGLHSEALRINNKNEREKSILEAANYCGSSMYF